MGVKLFVGAKVRYRTLETGEIVARSNIPAFLWIDAERDIFTDGGSWTAEPLEHSRDIVEVLNPEDDPDRQSATVNGSGKSAAGVGVILLVNDSIDRTAPPGIPEILREGWERSAYGFSLTDEEVRRLWGMVGFPLPAPRKRCDDCNCTGKDPATGIEWGSPNHATALDCDTCHGRGYLPV